MKLNKINLTIASAAIFLTSAASFAANPTQEIRQTASNYFAYPYPEKPLPKLTKAPKGYEPFHIEHYGRHGSRWHIGDWIYPQPIKLLEPAERAGKLTPRGIEILAQLRATEKASHGRDGELTPLGARQHRGIAQRMVKNFPQIFAKGTYVDAKSTPVVRCILSMSNELQEMKALQPGLIVTCDASKATKQILNYEHASAYNYSKETIDAMNQELAKVREAHKPSFDFLDKIVTDRSWAMDSLDVNALLGALFRIAANTQSHDDQPSLYDIFTEKELYDYWARSNADWFMQYGNTPITNGNGPMPQRYLLSDIIAGADSAMTSKNISANLRFGHEVALMPLTVLLELDHYGKEYTDMTSLENEWHNYEIFPMGSNIQLIFYRRHGSTDPDDVLVKALLNEHEATLPAGATKYPKYYRWTELRRHYLDRLSSQSK